MTEANGKPAKRLLGRIDRVYQNPRKVEQTGYGFILTADFKKFFFHTDDVPDQILPRVGTMVYFNMLPETAPGKRPRAVNIEIVSVPAR